MRSGRLNAVATSAQAPSPTWDELRVVLLLVSHSYVTWRVRPPVVARPVSDSAATVRRLRGGR